jgi:hypothetical protein
MERLVGQTHMLVAKPDAIWMNQESSCLTPLTLKMPKQTVAAANTSAPGLLRVWRPSDKAAYTDRKFKPAWHHSKQPLQSQSVSKTCPDTRQVILTRAVGAGGGGKQL